MDALKALDTGESFMMSSDWDLAESYLNISLAKAKGDTKTIISVQSKLSVVYYNTGRFFEGLDAVLKAFTLSGMSLNEFESHPELLINTSFVYQYRRNFTKSFEIAKKTLEMFKKEGNFNGVAMSYYIIGLSYFYSDNFSLAANYFEKASNIIEDKNSRKAYIFKFMRMHSLLAMKDYENGLAAMVECEEMAEKLGFDADKGRIIGFRAIMNFLTLNFEEGEKLLVKSEKIFNRINLRKGLIDIHLAKGIMHYKKKEMKEALEFLTKAIEGYNQMGEPVFQKRAEYYIEMIKNSSPEFFMGCC